MVLTHFILKFPPVLFPCLCLFPVDFAERGAMSASYITGHRAVLDRFVDAIMLRVRDNAPWKQRRCGRKTNGARGFYLFLKSLLPAQHFKENCYLLRASFPFLCEKLRSKHRKGAFAQKSRILPGADRTIFACWEYANPLVKWGGLSTGCRQSFETQDKNAHFPFPLF